MEDYDDSVLVDSCLVKKTTLNTLMVKLGGKLNLDQSMKILKDKKKEFAKIMNFSNIIRAHSVKNFASRMQKKKKQDEDMKKTRIFSNKILKKEVPNIQLTLLQTPKIEISEIVCYWNKLDTQGWIPETRECATLLGHNYKLYLIGGLGRNIMNQVLVFSFATSSWTKHDSFKYPLDPLFAHTCSLYSDTLIIFGGSSDYSEITRNREFINNTRILKTSTMDLDYLSSHGSLYEFRKYHTACVFKKHLFLYGGLNPKNLILDSSTVLNLVTLRWRIIDTTGENPGKIAGHTAESIYIPDNCKSLFSRTSKISSIKIQGIYLFGGYNSGYKALNKLFILKPSKRPLRWMLPEIEGTPPSPRYYHTMSWVKNIGCLVIYGGRNDEIGVNYGDVHMLKLDVLKWVRVVVNGHSPCARSSHSAAAHDGKIYIFGGVSYGKFCKSELWYLSFYFPHSHKKRQIFCLPNV